MQIYYNKKDGSFIKVKNFKLTPTEDEIEIDESLYNEIEKKRKEFYQPKIEISSKGEISVSYVLDDVLKQEVEQNKLRIKREPLLRAFDIYKSNVYYGIIKETEEDHNAIISWYDNLLDLKTSAFENVPVSIQRYLKNRN